MRRGSYTPAWRWTVVPLAALLGMGLVHTLPALPGPVAWRIWIALVVTLVFAMLVGRGSKGGRGLSARWLAWSLLAALAGAGLAAHRAEARMAGVLRADREGQVVTLTGRVDSLPQRTTGIGGADGWRFVLAVDPIEPAGKDPADAHAAVRDADMPSRVLLSCYQMPAVPRAGERWRLDVKLRRPYGLMNPHGFDQALWMLEQDLPAAGSCRSRGQVRLTTGGFGIDALRQSLRDAIDRQLGERHDRRGAGVLAALSLGDQGAVWFAVIESTATVSVPFLL